MKTLIVGDIHLCTSKNDEDVFLSNWLSNLVTAHNPEHIVFAGDTFELSFCTQQRSVLKDPADILKEILAVHSDFFSFLQRDLSLKKVTFLIGEHDYFLLRGLSTEIEHLLPEKDVAIEEYFYDAKTKLLAIHGHQLDYNLIPAYDMDEVLTDKLTRVFENFIFQDPVKSARVLKAFGQQRFSFWYAAGRVPNYIEATSEIFGHDRDVYYRELSQMLHSDFMTNWLRDLRNPLNKRIGQLARTLSFFSPRYLHWISRLWWAFAQAVVKNRALAILKGNVDPTLVSIPQDMSVDNLVVGHTHHNGVIQFRNRGVQKAYYCASSPRWYIRGIKADHLELHRDTGSVMIGADAKVAYIASNEDRKIAVPAVESYA